MRAHKRGVGACRLITLVGLLAVLLEVLSLADSMVPFDFAVLIDTSMPNPDQNEQQITGAATSNLNLNSKSKSKPKSSLNYIAGVWKVWN